jgi:hypothetical protein
MRGMEYSRTGGPIDGLQLIVEGRRWHGAALYHLSFQEQRVTST